MHNGLTPMGQFYCKGCKQHKPLAERAKKYGKCKECENGN